VAQQESIVLANVVGRGHLFNSDRSPDGDPQAVASVPTAYREYRHRERTSHRYKAAETS
jgi:hypothetical protein